VSCVADASRTKMARQVDAKPLLNVTVYMLSLELWFTTSQLLVHAFSIVSALWPIVFFCFHVQRPFLLKQYKQSRSRCAPASVYSTVVGKGQRAVLGVDNQTALYNYRTRSQKLKLNCSEFSSLFCKRIPFRGVSSRASRAAIDSSQARQPNGCPGLFLLGSSEAI
jgi:hypothetical protein